MNVKVLAEYAKLVGGRAETDRLRFAIALPPVLVAVIV